MPIVTAGWLFAEGGVEALCQFKIALSARFQGAIHFRRNRKMTRQGRGIWKVAASLVVLGAVAFDLFNKKRAGAAG